MKPAESERRIRVGIVLDSRNVPTWQHSTLQQIVESDYAEIALVLVAGQNDQNSTDTKGGRFIYRWFLQYEAKKQQISPDACALKDVTELLSKFPQVPLPQACRSGRVDKNSRFFNDLQDKNIDVLVSLADGELAEGLFSACADGFWHFQHDYQDMNRNDHASAGFREFITHQPYITARLLVKRNQSGQAELAYVTCSGLNKLSYLESRNEHLWKISTIVPRVLRRLHNDGSQRFSDSIRHNISSESHYDFKPALPLSNARLLLPLIRYFGWRFRQKILRKFYSEKWHLMFSFRQNLHGLESFQTITSPTDKFWADPFIFKRDNVFYVFFEEAKLSTGVGHISVMEMGLDGNLKRPKTIVKRPYHLSYPFVFEYKSSLYMIPESAENRSIEIYKCIDFPFKWEFDRYLMKDVSAYDATLIEDEGTWWMFANIGELDGAASEDELCLFFSDSPLSSNWTPHPMNPIVSDVRIARPAGALYRDGGRLYRPSQNSSNRYGYGLNINRVTELSKSAYREEVIEEFKPNWDRSVKALHTYNRCGELTMIDAIRSSRRR